jgi:DNA repair protein RadC
MAYISIKEWATDDRPREKLLNKGVRALSESELLAILIGSGTHEISAVELAREILNLSKNNLSELGKKSVAELTKLKGIGEAKAITIVAAFELGRRRNYTDTPEKTIVTTSNEVFNYFRPLISDISHEEFWVLYLNRSNRVIDQYKLSQGGLSGTVIDIRLIFKRALELLASSIIVCHNHPSGNRNPSDNDKAITTKLKIAGAQLEIRLLDHLIIADNLYFSFADEGIL